jgi:hypothetical protein
MQQGRVQLDSDWNEQIDIQRHLLKQRTEDAVGQCGAPIHDAGFALTVDKDSILIGSGHYYVEGILCENERKCEFTEQDDLPDIKLPTEQGDYLFYLDIWQRHITAVDDDSIREVALGGPDTATRTKTVWQVKYRKVTEKLDENPCIQDFSVWNNLTSARNARLKADAPPEEPSEDPCIVPPGAGYRGLANHLYRVEIHKSGKTGEATFKWSRENGSIVRAIEKIDTTTDTITIVNPGQDVLHAFAPYQWVEITDDLRELTEQPGTLVRLTEVSDGVTLTFDPATAIGAPINNTNFPEEHSPRVRRWDQTGSGEVKTGTELPALEHGLKVCFESGNEYQSGDYWLIPARAAEGTIEWPKDSSDKPLALPRFGIMHHYCPLAIFHYDDGETGIWKRIKDCRNIFPPMTEMVTLSYVSGDGQEAMPGDWLPAPLEVRVSIGEHPIEDARVLFTITEGKGSLQHEVVMTDTSGIASCSWQLDKKNQSQQAEATLLDVVLLDRDGNPVLDGGEDVHPSIRFNANLSRASHVAYDPEECIYLREKEIGTVQAAIDELCKRKEEEPGIHIDKVLKGSEVLGNYTEVSVDELAEGLSIVCDEEVDPDTVEGKPTCYVTLYMPYPFNRADRNLWDLPDDPVIGFQPLILAADVKSDGAVIYWNPADATGSWLQQSLLGMMEEMGCGDRVLASLTLKGNFIWAEGDHFRYLDGEAFGVPENHTESNLDLSSGNDRRGGDFEMWFWLVGEAGAVEYVKYNVSKEKKLIVVNGLCADGKKNCEAQNGISGGRYYAKVGARVAVNGNPGILSKLILEHEVTDKKTLATGEVWDIGDGYSLVARKIDLEGAKVWLELQRNGAEIYNAVVESGGVYTRVAESIADETNVPMFVTYVDAIFRGTETNMVQLCYTWLISDDIKTIA